MMAPPQPGIAPRKDAIGTCNFFVLSKKRTDIKVSKRVQTNKNNNVNPTKTDTARYASTID